MLCLFFWRKLKSHLALDKAIQFMVDKTAADKIKTVLLSNDTVSCRIDKMGTYIVEQLLDKLRAGESFSLQLDESVDVSGQAQLVAFARYGDTSDIRQHILFCKTLKRRTTGEDIFNIVNLFFSEHKISWKSCTSVCTD